MTSEGKSYNAKSTQYRKDGTRNRRHRERLVRNSIWSLLAHRENPNHCGVSYCSDCSYQINMLQFSEVEFLPLFEETHQDPFCHGSNVFCIQLSKMVSYPEKPFHFKVNKQAKKKKSCHILGSSSFLASRLPSYSAVSSCSS